MQHNAAKKLLALIVGILLAPTVHAINSDNEETEHNFRTQRIIQRGFKITNFVQRTNFLSREIDELAKSPHLCENQAKVANLVSEVERLQAEFRAFIESEKDTI